MDKENSHANLTNTTQSVVSFMTSSSPNILSESASKKVTNVGPSSPLSSIGSNMNQDDFSFQKLRGNLVQFEKMQRDHHFKLLHPVQVRDVVVNVMSGDCGPPPTMVTKEKDTASSTPILSKKQCQKQKPEHVKKETCNNTLSPVPAKDEDFAFDKLRKRALKLEEKNPIITSSKTKSFPKQNQVDETAEDFSFQRLKQKAIDIEKNGVETPIRNKSKGILYSTNHTINTPSHTKTPAKRSVPTTPQTAVASNNKIGAKNLPSVPVQSPVVIHGQPFRSTPQTQSKTNLSSVPTKSVSATTFNPHRYKVGPKIKKEEVEATDNSIASVQKLSQWLSDDPFQKKKQIVIRRGAQIAQKSRAFEKDEILQSLSGGSHKNESRVEREREHFPVGKVSQGKNWLEHAFGERNVEQEEELSGVLGKQKMIENAFKRKGGTCLH